MTLHTSQSGDSYFINANLPILERPSLFPSIQTNDHVIIFAGVRGCGKTQTLIEVINAYGEDARKLGIAITEISGASPSVDLERLPPEITDRVGIEGCACCAANKQLIKKLKNLQNLGRQKLLIEQSGFSDAAELKRTLIAEGFNVKVVAIINPNQIKTFEDHQFRHIRAADAILASHVTDKNFDQTESIDKLNKFASDCLGSRRTPIFYDNLSPESLVKLFNHINSENLVQINSASSDRANSTISLGDPKARLDVKYEMKRKEDVANFSETLIFPYKVEDLEALKERISNFSVDGNKNIIRAKGVITKDSTTYDVDMYREDNGGLTLSFAIRQTESGLFNGRDFLIVSSVDPKFKETSLIELYKQIGIMNINEDAINGIRDQYPTREEIFESVLKHKDLLVTYPADRNLDELIAILPDAAQLEARSPTDFEDFEYALKDLVYEHLRVRGDLLEALKSNHASQMENLNEKLITTCYSTLRVLSHPIIAKVIDNDTDMFEPVIQNINDLKPLETLLAAIATTDKLLINEDSEISPLIYATFRNIFSLYKFDKALASKATENIKAVVARYPSDNRQATWLKIIDLLNNN
jgi:G3E family GTPase